MISDFKGLMYKYNTKIQHNTQMKSTSFKTNEELNVAF